MDCRSYTRALELAARPMVLPDELTRSDRRDLDEAVFELLGVFDPLERRSLVDQLYSEVAGHFRAIRVTEIQKMEDRAKGGKQEFRTEELAADAWDALDLEDVQPAADWLRQQIAGSSQTFEIPRERPLTLAAGSIFESEKVYFGKQRKRHLVCSNREVAELVSAVAEVGFSGICVLPVEPNEAGTLQQAFVARHTRSLERMAELVTSRTSDPESQTEVMGVLERWFVFGRKPVERVVD